MEEEQSLQLVTHSDLSSQNSLQRSDKAEEEEESSEPDLMGGQRLPIVPVFLANLHNKHTGLKHRRSRATPVSQHPSSPPSPPPPSTSEVQLTRRERLEEFLYRRPWLRPLYQVLRAHTDSTQMPAESQALLRKLAFLVTALILFWILTLVLPQTLLHSYYYGSGQLHVNLEQVWRQTLSEEEEMVAATTNTNEPVFPRFTEQAEKRYDYPTFRDWSTFQASLPGSGQCDDQLPLFSSSEEEETDANRLLNQTLQLHWHPSRRPSAQDQIFFWTGALSVIPNASAFPCVCTVLVQNTVQSWFLPELLEQVRPRHYSVQVKEPSILADDHNVIRLQMLPESIRLLAHVYPALGPTTTDHRSTPRQWTRVRQTIELTDVQDMITAMNCIRFLVR